MKELFLPVLVISILYFAFYRTTYFKKNIKRKNPKLYFGIHVCLAVLSAVFVALHVSSKVAFFAMIPIWFKVTGILMLLLLVAQFVIGIRMKQKPNRNLFQYHRTIPCALLALVLVHAVVLKMVYFG